MLPRLNSHSNPNHRIRWNNLAPRLTEPKGFWEKWCVFLIDKMRRDKLTNKFNMPVDPDAVGNHNYLKVIKVPMDLQTIYQKLSYRQYVSLAEVRKDFDRIGKNCLKFHKENSDEYKLGLHFKKIVEEEWAKCPFKDTSQTPFTKGDKISEEKNKTSDSQKSAESARPATTREKQSLSAVPTKKSKLPRDPSPSVKEKTKLVSISRDQVPVVPIPLPEQAVKRKAGRAKRECDRKDTRACKSRASIHLNAFPRKPIERYKSIYEFTRCDNAVKQRMTDEMFDMSDKNLISLLRIIQIRRAERGHSVPSISKMCDRPIDLATISTSIMFELMDFMKMIKINGPRLDQYIREMEDRRRELNLEEACSLETVHQKRRNWYTILELGSASKQKQSEPAVRKEKCSDRSSLKQLAAPSKPIMNSCDVSVKKPCLKTSTTGSPLKNYKPKPLTITVDQRNALSDVVNSLVHSNKKEFKERLARKRPAPIDSMNELMTDGPCTKQKMVIELKVSATVLIDPADEDKPVEPVATKVPLSAPPLTEEEQRILRDQQHKEGLERQAAWLRRLNDAKKGDFRHQAEAMKDFELNNPY